MEPGTFVVIDFAAAKHAIYARPETTRCEVIAQLIGDIPIELLLELSVMLGQTGLSPGLNLKHFRWRILHAAGELRHRAPVRRGLRNSPETLEQFGQPKLRDEIALIDVQRSLKAAALALVIAPAAIGRCEVHLKRRLARIELGCAEKAGNCPIEIAIGQRAHPARIVRARIVGPRSDRLLEMRYFLCRAPRLPCLRSSAQQRFRIFLHLPHNRARL